MSTRVGPHVMRGQRRYNTICIPRVTIGATGAATLTSSDGGMISAWSRETTGRYTVTFADKHASVFPIQPVTDYQETEVDGGHWAIETAYDSSTGIIVLSHVVNAAEADPASGVVIDFPFLVAGS